MNPSTCPDSTVWYNPDYGEATAGELRAMTPDVVQPEKAEEIFTYRLET